MNQVWSNGSYLPNVAASLVHTPVNPQSGHSCSIGFFQGTPTKSLAGMTQNLPSIAVGSTPTPQPPNTCQYYEALNPMHPYTTLPLQGGPVMFLHKTVQNPLNMVMAGTRPVLGPFQNSCDGPQKNGTAADLTAYQLRNPSSSLPQGVVGAGAHCSQKAEDVLQKRELRLMKNREAARECRRKKKEYVKCLENRVAVLENQNKTLIEELRALKDIYRHKAE